MDYTQIPAAGKLAMLERTCFTTIVWLEAKALFTSEDRVGVGPSRLRREGGGGSRACRP